MLSRFSLYYHTLRYLRPIQFIYKALFSIKFRAYRYWPELWGWIYGSGDPVNVRGTHFTPPIEARKLFYSRLDLARVGQRMGGVLDNEFSYLNVSHRFEDGVDWQCRTMSHLWRYQLHYFRYGISLAAAWEATGDRRYAVKFKELVNSWIDRNPIGRRDGWHPYTISLRVVNWFYAYQLLGNFLDEEPEFRQHWLNSMNQQCRFLYNNLEFQAFGNHLLANIKALFFGGLFFSGAEADKWTAASTRLLAQELDEQVLEDGGHFERSPTYHILTLVDLVQYYRLAVQGGMPIVESLAKKIEHMATWTRSMLTPDLRIPLLNDSSIDLTPDPRLALQAVEEIDDVASPASFFILLVELFDGKSPLSKEIQRAESVSLAATGYYIMRGSEGSVMYLDCGRVCPDYLPPHAHADTLAYELWIRDKPVITDSGVFEYTPGAWRDFFRGTRAHNTLVVDGYDQSEVWDSFRVARRAFPLDAHMVSTEVADYFCGSHDGYTRLHDSVIHCRRVVSLKGHWWLIIDQCTGDGHHRFDNYIHLDPAVGFRVRDDKENLFDLVRDGFEFNLAAFGHETMSYYRGEEQPPQGWVSANFGEKVSRLSLCQSLSGNLPVTMGYILIEAKCDTFEVAYDLSETEDYWISIDDQHWRVTVDLSREILNVSTD